jgi:hypothetical protein
MPKPPSSNMLTKVFVMINAAAVNGERCPQKQPSGTFSREQNDALLALARAGKLRVEIFVHNWRVVTICEGPNSGRHTMLPPKRPYPIKPYKVIAKGDLPVGQRSQPSPPRLLQQV